MSWISLSRHSLFRHTIQALHTDVFNVKCILPQTKKTKKKHEKRCGDLGNRRQQHWSDSRELKVKGNN